jgi:hypothetical protein
MYAQIKASFDVMVKNYHMHNAMPPFLKAYLVELQKQAPNATQCCMQLSHALNAAGVTIPERGKPGRRWDGKNPAIPGGNGNYLLAVDEVEDFLTGRFGRTDEAKGNPASMWPLKKPLLGREGILVFRDGGEGYHTELWNGRQVHQSTISGNMTESGIFAQKRVLFWEVLSGEGRPSLPEWLRGWWEVKDGNTYYYWFSDQPGAFYTEKRPTSASMLPEAAMPQNYATVKMAAGGPILTWRAVGQLQSTVETFTRLPNGTMRGTSNQYGPLTATKM